MHRTNGEGNVAGAFTGGPPATCLTPEFLNSIQEEICNVIEYAGLTVATDGYSDTKTQLLTAIRTLVPKSAPYTVIVSTQAEFNAIITRIGANHYHIADANITVLLKYLAGGYKCYGATSFLSGGNAYGYIQTNLCTHLKMENGAYLDCGDTAFYLEANTNNCKLENVWIKGTGTVAAALTRSFYATGLRMTFDNCKTSNRYASAAFNGFEGTNVAATDITNKYINCSAFSLQTSSVGAADYLCGFNYCYNICLCLVSTLTSSRWLYGFYNCNNVSNCIAYSLLVVATAGTGLCVGFYGCKCVSSCMAYDFNASGAGAMANGFYCFNMSSCYANKIDAVDTSSGFNNCSYLSACQANDIDSSAGSAYGFYSCDYGSSLYTTEANNASNDFINTDDVAIATNFSCPAVFT